MSVIVQKFGGTSMADPSRIGKAADRVVAARDAGHDVVVVVSAMGQTTDELLALADEVTAQRCDRERDMLVTVGERIATALLCMALQARGCESISFTGSQAGILTNDRHQDARIIEVRPVRVEDELARGRVVVVAGYQGVSYKREITSLGRGGSDTTAVALAAALGAEAVEIYSDVDGVYSANPRHVPGAVRLDQLDVEAMADLARGGARVLAADAVEFARREGIALYCRATDPADGKGQTLVRRFPAEDVDIPRVLAVSGRDDLILRRCPLEDAADQLDAVPAPGVEMVLAVGEELLILSAGEGAAGLVTAVGQRLDSPELLARFLGVLEDQGVTIEGLSVSAHAIRAVVPAGSVDDLVRAVHAELVSSSC